jgi:hypothetical protein
VKIVLDEGIPKLNAIVQDSEKSDEKLKNQSMYLCMHLLSRAKNSGRQCHFKVWLDGHTFKKIPA